MKRNLIYLIILIIIFFVFYVFFKGLNKVNIYTPNEITNKKIVNFSSKELYTQKNVSFSDILLDNKFTIVNIWSSWCLPCRKEHSYLISHSSSEIGNFPFLFDQNLFVLFQLMKQHLPYQEF